MARVALMRTAMQKVTDVFCVRDQFTSFFYNFQRHFHTVILSKNSYSFLDTYKYTSLHKCILVRRPN